MNTRRSRAPQSTHRWPITAVRQAVLRRGGIAVTGFADYPDPDLLLAAVPDLAVLDVMLPSGDGSSWRASRAPPVILPIVFLTARDAVEDRLGGFELGADDYLVKPFALEVLLARVRAVLRRTGRLGAAIEAADVVRTNRLAWPRGRFATRADPDRASTTRHTSSASAAWSSPSTS